MEQEENVQHQEQENNQTETQAVTLDDVRKLIDEGFDKHKEAINKRVKEHLGQLKQQAPVEKEKPETGYLTKDEFLSRQRKSLEMGELLGSLPEPVKAKAKEIEDFDAQFDFVRHASEVAKLLKPAEQPEAPKVNQSVTDRSGVPANNGPIPTLPKSQTEFKQWRIKSPDKWKAASEFFQNNPGELAKLPRY